MEALLLTLLTCNQAQFFTEEWSYHQSEQKLLSSMPAFENRVTALVKSCHQPLQFCEEIYPLLSARSEFFDFMLRDGSITEDQYGDLIIPIGNVFDIFLNTCEN